jgi:hypothetical protein
MLGYFQFSGVVMGAAGAACLLYEWHLAFAATNLNAGKQKIRFRKLFPLAADERSMTEEVDRREVSDDTKEPVRVVWTGLRLLLVGFVLQAIGSSPAA